MEGSKYSAKYGNNFAAENEAYYAEDDVVSAARKDPDSKDRTIVESHDADEETSSKVGDENKERGNWSGRLDFILSCIGFAVGLGNVWRFPYVCYENGGGAFLIPYVIMLTLAGLPLFFMELAFGQFSSLGPIAIWKISPIFKGVGYAMVVISALVDIYYNVIIGWAFYYLFRSFTDVLPWENCNHDWNTELCFDRSLAANENATDAESNRTRFTLGLFQIQKACHNKEGLVNDSESDAQFNCSIPRPRLVSPSEEFFKRHVLEVSDGLDDMGAVRWQLALCLFLAWAVIFFCLIKGVKSSGKVVYFTATFPYLVLVTLLVRGAMLEGAANGILFYITPRWHFLTKAQTWARAASQIFYSLGPAFGGLITMSSYNRFNNNCYRDAIIVAVVNCGTSVFAGLVIFSVIGHMAFLMGDDVGNVVDDGPGLAFIVYPEGIAQMPIAPLWSVLFFLMLLSLGVGSQFVMVENIISAVIDEFPQVLRKRKIWVVLTVCVIMFLLGIPLICQGGMYLFKLMENYTAGLSLMIVAITECIVISYVYGYSRFANDINMMLGFKPNIYWRVCWCFLTPASTLAISAFAIFEYEPLSYNKYVLSGWGEVLGWLMFSASVICIPIGMIVQFWRQVGCVHAINTLSKPLPTWGPALMKHRKTDERYANTSADERTWQDDVISGWEEVAPPIYDISLEKDFLNVELHGNAKNNGPTIPASRVYKSAKRTKHDVYPDLEMTHM